jgi:hypothetical protein
MWGSLEKIHLQRLLRQEVLQLMDLPAKVYGYRRICAELRRRGMQVAQESAADDAERQPAGSATAAVRSHNQLESQIRGVFELSASYEAERDRSTLDSRYQLHSLEVRVRLPGSDPRCLFSKSRGLGIRSVAGEPIDDFCPRAGHRTATATTWFGSPLGPRTAIRSWRVCGDPGELRNRAQHEPSSQPVRQRELPKVS